jgi:hypothetical protein
MTLAENTQYLNIPAQLDEIRNATMRVLLVIEHPLRSDEFQGDYRRALPLAIVSLGEFYPRVDLAANELWTPAEADLNDAGKFLLALILDSYPERGRHYIASSLLQHEWSELPVEALQELVLATAPVPTTVN